MRTIKIISLLFVVSLITSCSSPSDPPEVKKSIREYTWRADTISYNNRFQTLLGNIWGSSDTDIYINGHCSSSRGNMWHYNGEKWEAIHILEYIGSRPMSFLSIDGSSEDNIWAVGQQTPNPVPYPVEPYKNFIVRFDGTVWKEEPVRVNEWSLGVKVFDKDDVWVTSTNGVVYHYDGDIWSFDTLKAKEGHPFSLGRIIKYQEDLYMSGVVYNKKMSSEEEIHLYRLENGEWKLVNSYLFTGNTIWSTGLSMGEDGNLYTGGTGIFRYDGNNWIKLYDTPMTSTSKVVADKNSNILATSYTSLIHYNGTDWAKISYFEELDKPILNIWMDEDEVFVIGYLVHDGKDKTVIYHGK